LPLGTPTLQATRTGNWTRPDNIFGTENVLELVTTCVTAPDLRGPRTDHVPIHLTLKLSSMKTKEAPRRNWRDTDWEKFNKRLSTLLSPIPPQPLASNEEFQNLAKHVTKAITTTMEELVPHTKPCPHSKHWWTKSLTTKCKQLRCLTHE
ncbi:uncharacterized protein HD556DRAFT_1215094, partial [Suillus plorans]